MLRHIQTDGEIHSVESLSRRANKLQTADVIERHSIGPEDNVKAPMSDEKIQFGKSTNMNVDVWMQCAEKMKTLETDEKEVKLVEEVIGYLQNGWPAHVEGRDMTRMTDYHTVYDPAVEKVMAKTMQKHVDNGFFQKFSSNPFPTQHPTKPGYNELQSQITVQHAVPKNKLKPMSDEGNTRVVNNASYPKGQSINDACTAPDAGMKYFTLRTWIALLVVCGVGAYMGLTDVKDAYKQLIMEEEAWPMQVYIVDGVYYVDMTGPNGTIYAGNNFDKFKWALTYIIRALVKGAESFNAFVDNLMWASAASVGAAMHMQVSEEIMSLLGELGIPTHETFKRTTEEKILGWIINTVEWTVKLPREKLSLYIQTLKWLGEKERWTMKEIMHVTHYASYLASVMTFLKPLIQPLFNMQTRCEKGEPEEQRRKNKARTYAVGEDVKRAVTRIGTYLLRSKGVVPLSARNLTVKHHNVVLTDARWSYDWENDKFGGGGIDMRNKRFFILPWDERIKTWATVSKQDMSHDEEEGVFGENAREGNISVPFLELLTSVVAIAVFAQKHDHILLKTDCLPNVYTLNKFYSGSAKAAAVLLYLSHIIVKHELWVSVMHVKRDLNTSPDKLSNGSIQAAAALRNGGYQEISKKDLQQSLNSIALLMT